MYTLERWREGLKEKGRLRAGRRDIEDGRDQRVVSRLGAEGWVNDGGNWVVFVKLWEWEEVVEREEVARKRGGRVVWAGKGGGVEGDRKEFNTWVSLAVRDIGKS